jgi:hypothetical protein
MQLPSFYPTQERQHTRQGIGTGHRLVPHARSGDYATIAELAERERIAPSYMTSVLRLTLLAPDSLRDPGTY